MIKKEFKPFTLKIDVNTLDEAKSLWNRFNLDYHSICEATEGRYYGVEYINAFECTKYWKQLNKVLKKLRREPEVRGFNLSYI